MLVTREIIGLKIQSAPGTPAIPDPLVDAILCSSPSVTNEGLRMLDRPNVKSSLATDQKVFAGTLKKVSFTCEFKGSGAAGTPPEIGQALRACALKETITPSTSVRYAPVSEGHEYATIYYWQDGKLLQVVDAVGTATITAESGAITTIAFEFTGKELGEPDTTFPIPAYDDTVPSPFINVPFSIDGFGAVIGSLTLNLGNTISLPGNVRDPNGFGTPRISKRDPNGSINPEAVTAATKDFTTKFKTGALMVMTTGVVGSVAGNRFEITQNVAIRDISQGEREQIRTNEMPYGAHESVLGAEDEFFIEFT